MSIQSSSDPKTVPMCRFTLDKIKSRNLELQTINELQRQKNLVHERAIEILKAENTELKRDLNSEKIEKEALIQLIEEDLQSSNRMLQYVCTIAGAILGGGLVLAFPVVAAPAIALVGTGSSATGIAVAGVAVAGGATGGYIVAPVIHEKTHKASIQQVQTFKTKQEVSKKVE